jgi:hypothetical protein
MRVSTIAEQGRLPSEIVQRACRPVDPIASRDYATDGDQTIGQGSVTERMDGRVARQAPGIDGMIAIISAAPADGLGRPRAISA